MDSSNQRQCVVYNCGLIPYLTAWEWQKELQQQRINNLQLDDVLILLEHPPVYTLGQGASLDNIKFSLSDPNYTIHRVERGGEVTYHYPGQIVGYLIFNLRYHQQDLHWYLRQLEEVIIRVLANYDLIGERIEGLTGVWVKGQKIAAIGIKVSKWVTLHGFSFNICPDLQGFDRIIPCGIRDRKVCSLREFIIDVNPDEVRQLLIQSIADIFHLQPKIVNSGQLIVDS